MLSAITVAATLATHFPYELRTESLTNPLGLDEPVPRLSWKLRAASPKLRNLSQKRFRILVASSPDKLQQESGDLWDSGPVESARTYGIEYAGKPLKSFQRCWWTVRSWDQADVPSDWAPAALWTMGLLSPGDWQSKWISIGAPVHKADPVFAGTSWIWSSTDTDFKAEAVTRYFSKTFEVVDPKSISSAILHISADDRFILRLNGRPITSTEGVFDEWRHPATLNLRPYLKAGQNKLEVDASNNSSGPAGLVAKLILIDRAKVETSIVTDDSWAVRDNADSTEMPAHVLVPYGAEPWGKFASPEVRAATYYRRDFQASKPIRHATLTVTALGCVAVQLNGKPVAEDLFTPGWTDYRKRVCYRTYDVTEKLTQGVNAIGAVLGEGWYAGYIGWGGGREYYGSEPKVRVQLNVEYADGTTEVLGTDAHWRATTGPIVEQSILHGETYDARAEMPGWSNADFDDHRWQTPTVHPEIEANLEAFPSQPVLPYAEVKFKSVRKVRPGTYLVDFGQNLAGFAKIRIREERGTKIVIRFGERLGPDRQLYTTNLRGARAIDTYICKGGGEESWSPRMTFHGFQYAEISGLSSAPTRGQLTAIAISTATPEVGMLQTSDAMLNKLVSNAWWTQKMNFIDVPTDCPQRDERLGWTGDAQAYIRTASYFSDIQPFFKKWLATLDDGQRADGQYPTVAPLVVSGDDGGPAWADAGVICPWTTYEVYGDLRLLGKHYPQMKRFVEFCRQRSTPELLPPADIAGFDDWLNIDATTPREVIATAYFAGSTRLLSQAAKALGNEDDAAKYAELYQRIRKAFSSAYVTEGGKVKGDTQCGYVLTLAFDLLDAKEEADAARRLVADIEKRGWHLSTGFVGTRDILHVLSKIGRSDVAFRLLHNTTFPSWGFTIVNGATSIWERWDGWTPEKGFQDPGMNSFAHYAYGSVVGWMFAQLAGIQDETPGYDIICIAPNIDPNLKWAKGSYDSIHGPIRTEWKYAGGRLTLVVEVPPNTTAVVNVPATGQVQAPKGASLESDGTYRIGSGSYRFEADLDVRTKS